MVSSSGQLDYVAPKNCTKCARLAQFIASQKQPHPHWHNAPVPSFGPIDAEVLVVGLAPGLKGANATGRPFTGDFAGNVLYQALASHNYCSGQFSPDGNDNLMLHNIRIINAVRCVPPQNKPTASEIANCRGYLIAELKRMKHLKLVFALGRIAHDTCLTHFGLQKSKYPFSHGSTHQLPNGLWLLSSYHCSRYNIQTNRLTQKQFTKAVGQIANYI